MLMLNVIRILKKDSSIVVKLLPLIVFIIPFLILYFYRNTSGLYFSFDMTWKGRTYYIFFLWIAFMEMALEWDKLWLNKVNTLQSIRTVAFVLALFLPSTYIISSNYYGFPSKAIVDWTWQNKIEQVDWMPLHFEYFVLAMLFVLIIWLQYGISGLKRILIAPTFMVAIGTIYLIDNIYRYGSFTPFQILVPTTATLAACVLNFLGYQTTFLPSIALNMPRLLARNTKGFAWFDVAWPCSGIESLIIYTLMILLFLKKSTIPLWGKAIWFVIGATVTYLINVLRIVTIYVIAIDYGINSPQRIQFHDFYGQLYSITWIIAYPLIIIGCQLLWDKIKNNGKAKRNVPPGKTFKIAI